MVPDEFVELLKTCQDEKQLSSFANYILDKYIETNNFSSILLVEGPNKSTRTTNGGESNYSQL